MIDGSAFANCQRIEKGMKHMSQTGITFSGGFRLTNQDKCAKCFITLQDNPEIRDSVCQIAEGCFAHVCSLEFALLGQIAKYRRLAQKHSPGARLQKSSFLIESPNSAKDPFLLAKNHNY